MGDENKTLSSTTSIQQRLSLYPEDANLAYWEARLIEEVMSPQSAPAPHPQLNRIRSALAKLEQGPGIGPCSLLAAIQPQKQWVL